MSALLNDEFQITLTEEQSGALDFVISNLQLSQLVALAGPAGSGKTSILKSLVREFEKVGIEVVVAATTHKAARVLWSKGLVACTSHSATCRPVFDPPYDVLGAIFDALNLGVKLTLPEEIKKELIEEFGAKALARACESARNSGLYAGFRTLDIHDSSDYIRGYAPREPRPGVLIIDEASMLGSDVFEKAKLVFSKIILVGDENQLPPVKSEAIFWNVTPRIALKEIHRQAAGSQPLKIAQTILAGDKRISLKNEEAIDAETCGNGTPVLVWTNRTRIRLTQEIRQKLGFSSNMPQEGELLVCKNKMDKRAKARGLVNNSLWTVQEVKGRRFDLVGEDGSEVHGQELHMDETKDGEGLPFMFAYAMTVHSSQGSSFDKVMVHCPDGRMFFDHNSKEARQWLYTAVTRAEKRVIFVGNKVK